MTFTESIATCFKKIVNYKGRASRSEFWWFWLLGVVFYLLFKFKVVIRYITISEIISFVVILILFVYSLALVSACVRRLHDTNYSGWWLLGFVSLVIFSKLISIISKKTGHIVYGKLGLGVLEIYVIAFLIIIIVWLCQDSNKMINKYGERKLK
jgi:uncharacterized membrane protein YhaH (DUF805 family)